MSLTVTQQAWVNDRTARRVLTIELPASGDLDAVYLSTEPFTSNGTLAVTFQPIIKGEFILRRAVGGLLLGGGPNETGLGRITVSDRDNRLASWTFQDWRDRPANIRWGDPTWGDLDDHVFIQRAFVDGVEPGDGEKAIIARPAFEASRFLLPDARYNSALGGESEGEPIQIAWGRIKDAPVQLIDENNLLYGMSGIVDNTAFLQSITVKDNGVTLTPTTDWTSGNQGTVPKAFTRLDLDNVIGTVTFDSSSAGGVEADDVLGSILNGLIAIFSVSFTQSTSTAMASLEIGKLIREPEAVADIYDDITLSTGHVWFLGGSTFIGTPNVNFVQITLPGTPVFTFSERNIRGGITSAKVSDAVESIVIGVRNSWAESGDDAIDPALAPKVKRDLQKTHTFQVASVNQQKVDDQEPPRDLEPIETLLTDSTQAFEEGKRWQKLLSVERRIHSFRALAGAGQVQPMDSIQIEHVDLSDYSPLTDENGEVITDGDFVPLLSGTRALVKVLEESFPSGAVQIEAWI